MLRHEGDGERDGYRVGFTKDLAASRKTWRLHERLGGFTTFGFTEGGNVLLPFSFVPTKLDQSEGEGDARRAGEVGAQNGGKPNLQTAFSVLVLGEVFHDAVGVIEANPKMIC
jgi:hypothetical protein